MWSALRSTPTSPAEVPRETSAQRGDQLYRPGSVGVEPSLQVLSFVNPTLTDEKLGGVAGRQFAALCLRLHSSSIDSLTATASLRLSQ